MASDLKHFVLYTICNRFFKVNLCINSSRKLNANLNTISLVNEAAIQTKKRCFRFLRTHKNLPFHNQDIAI